MKKLIAFLTSFLWSLAVYAADAPTIVAELKKRGLLVPGADAKATEVINGLNQTVWFDVGWAIKIIGVLIVVITLHAYILKVIKNIWFLLSRIPLWCYQLTAVALTSIPTFAPKMLWAGQFEIVGLIGGIAWLGSLGWLATTYRVALMRWCQKIKIPTHIRVMTLISVMCIGLSTVQGVWWWMWPYPLLMTVLMTLKPFDKDWSSWHLGTWEPQVRPQYLAALIGVSYMLLGDHLMLGVYVLLVSMLLFGKMAIDDRHLKWSAIVPAAVVAMGISGVLIPIYAGVLGAVLHLSGKVGSKLLSYSTLFSVLVFGVILVGIGVAVQEHMAIIQTYFWQVWDFVTRVYWSWPTQYTYKFYY